MELCAGIDIGSKTIKGVVLDASKGDKHALENRIAFSAYRPHNGQTAAALHELLGDMQQACEGAACALSLTGSGSISLAEACGARFVQEVVATRRAVGILYPQAQAAIELGGEDAKVLYLSRPLQQRMNTSCAGGTGSYLEDVARLMGADMQTLDELAGKGVARYQIASRCAVFALRDLKPLLAGGADRADLAASVYAAVVDQTLATLCAGRKPQGCVAFLGGPFAHLPHLVEAFANALSLAREEAVVPEHAQLAAAIGAALCAGEGESLNPAPLPSRQPDSSTPAPAAPSLRMTEPEEHPDMTTQLAAHPPSAAFDAMAEVDVASADTAPSLRMTEVDVASAGTAPSLRMTEPEEHPDMTAGGCTTLAEFAERAHATHTLSADMPRLAPLAASTEVAESDPTSFRRFQQVSLAEAALPLYAGFDAGSTTVKLAVVDSDGRLVFSRYNANPQDSEKSARAMWEELADACNACGIDVARAVERIATCGYGEDAIADAMGAQDILAETTAHCRGALEAFPQASFILDIGGQDMKAMWVKDGQIADVAVNETCSSGCGAFMSSAASALGISLAKLDEKALEAASPVDLGARCTVFMRSRIRAAQEQQADTADIAAGAAYSVAGNALRRLIGPRRIDTLGDFIVVQGGAFASDAVLAAFEAELGRKVHRSSLGPLMGALGAALTARERAQAARRATFCQAEASQAEREADAALAPNVVAFQQHLLASYRGFEAQGCRGRIRVGLACALGDFEALPFWHTVLKELGFSVVVYSDCEQAVAQSDVAATLPSDMVCMPARLLHKRALQLITAGASCILCPSSEEAGTCPVTREYQEVLPSALAAVAPETPVVVPKLGNFSPRAMGRELADPESLRACLEELLEPGDAISTSELKRAVRAGQAEYASFVARVEGATQDALDWIHAKPHRHGIVISGRSYHTDAELLGDLDAIVHEQGFAVIPPMGIAKQARAARRPFIDHSIDRRRTWIAAKHVLGYAALSITDPQLDTIFLQSFGCGMDAVSLVDVEKLLGEHGRPFTLVKIDSKADPKHTRLRVRALAEAIESRRTHELAQQDKTRGDAAGHGREGEASPKIELTIAREFDDALPKVAFEGVRPEDAEYAQHSLPSDICSTAALLSAYAIRTARENPGATVQLPYVCDECILQSVQHFVTLAGLDNLVDWVSDWPAADAGETALDAASVERGTGDARRVGLVGSPLLLFDEVANQGIVEFIKSQGVEAVLPELPSWYSDVAHYLPQLESLEAQGVDHVIVLQSFLCLKTHVYVRGAMPQLQARFPQMTFHVIDIDCQASELNLRNRVLMALEEL